MAKYSYTDFDIEMTRQPDGDVLMDTDLESIKNSISNILSTIKGSRRMLPPFGGNLERILFEPIDEITGRKLGNEMLREIETWDQRVNIRGVDIGVDYDTNRYDAKIDYTIKGFGQRGEDYIRLILKRL
jgi:phage baseplate assembly protein W